MTSSAMACTAVPRTAASSRACHGMALRASTAGLTAQQRVGEIGDQRLGGLRGGGLLQQQEDVEGGAVHGRLQNSSVPGSGSSGWIGANSSNSERLPSSGTSG